MLGLDSMWFKIGEMKKMSVSKLRKLLRDFHRDIGLKQKHSKMSASKLRSFVSRNRYQEMLYGDDDMKFLMLEDDKKEKKGKKERKEKEPKEPKESKPKEQTSQNTIKLKFSWKIMIENL